MTKLHWLGWLFALLAGWASAASPAPRATVLTVDGAIGPATADYIARGITRAAASGDGLVVLQLDTPGGLDTSMRTAIKAILSSRLPVVVFIGPSGARAASAGTYLVYASHIAAMAPGTNLGAATPVAIGIQPSSPEPASRPADAKRPVPEAAGEASDDGSAMKRKQVNDAAAYLRGLAQLRGRNAEWAERAVRESLSLTAEEALRQGVIELVATDLRTLMARLDGRTVTVLGQQQTLHTAAAPLVAVLPDWRTGLLTALTNPSVALILMTIGIYGLLFEFMSPGMVLPGVVGAICLVLGLYALQLLPINYAGLALVVLGLVFITAEAFVPSFGVLGFGGVAAFVAGGLILIDTELPAYGISPALLGALGIAAAVLTIGSVRLALKTRKRPVTSGPAGMIGELAVVTALARADGLQAWVRVEGEQWRAISKTALCPGQQVRIVARQGLDLTVVPVDIQPSGR